MGLVVVFLIAVLGKAPLVDEKATVDSPLIGHAVPRLAGTDTDGRPLDIRADRGRWVVVNFFATWCVPCREEHPEFLKFWAEHQAVGDVDLIQLIYGDSLDAVAKFRTEQGGTWPIVDDRGGTMSIDFGVSGIPETFVIRPDGTVAKQIIGKITAAQLDKLIAQPDSRHA